ncbi:MAG: hypothetical protein M0R77_00150 [Gammaproteobacteria bacterium]|nr:hypothetical protein [Acholeplasmataceae bacterium]MCK9528965.1 hypothetical protein [Gammaproteobacteria bacterium]
MIIQHKSRLDNSVNFIFPTGEEARYVNREDDKLLIYLSSQTGCKQACRFCHLTQTKQVEDTNVSYTDLIKQFDMVYEHYYKFVEAEIIKPADTIHLNFMARGEPLLNASVVRSNDWVNKEEFSLNHFKERRLNVSTIIPKDYHPDSFSVELYPTHFFYSLYSLNTDFRKRWLPNALDPEEAFHLLNEYSVKTAIPITIHHTLIKGENDSVEEALLIQQYMSRFKISPRFNLVRYNPYSSLQGEESSEEAIKAYLEVIKPYSQRVRIVPRVGRDVFASCGTFFDFNAK